MSLLERSFLDIRNLDLMARQATWIHQLDPRTKVATTLLFIIMVVSMDKYAIAQLLPFLIFPVVLIEFGNLSALYLLKKIGLVAPFAILLGIFNPLIDRTVLVQIGPVDISGGWISFASLLIRFILTVGMALVLVALTGFNGICLALEQFRVPRIFVTQLMFLYRYLFVLVDEFSRMTRARALRSFDKRGPGIQTFSYMIGNLLLKATSRAERIHLAMCCRGFDGTVRIMRKNRLKAVDAVFFAGWASLFLLFRMYNIPHFLGSGVLELFQ